MSLRQIGFVLALLFVITPVFAFECPSADRIGSVSGWLKTVYYTDSGRTLSFMKKQVASTERGKELICVYSYFNTDNNRMMPPALVLRSIIN